MNLRNRKTLKKNFSKGRLLSENDFSDLIDSSVNKIDDGFAKDNQNGLQLAPSIESNQILSVFNEITDKKPLWHLDLEEDNEEKLLSLYGPYADKYLSFHENGNIGINTQKPAFDLEINGSVGMKGRIGTYAWGKKNGDGQWHTILEEPEGMGAYEVVAFITGASKTAQHAGLHATIIKVFNKIKIKKVRTNKGWFLNGLRIRWKKHKSNEENADLWLLQLRTWRAYIKGKDGPARKIEYHVTKLY